MRKNMRTKNFSLALIVLSCASCTTSVAEEIGSIESNKESTDFSYEKIDLTSLNYYVDDAIHESSSGDDSDVYDVCDFIGAPNDSGWMLLEIKKASYNSHTCTSKGMFGVNSYTKIEYQTVLDFESKTSLENQLDIIYSVRTNLGRQIKPGDIMLVGYIDIDGIKILSDFLFVQDQNDLASNHESNNQRKYDLPSDAFVFADTVNKYYSDIASYCPEKKDLVVLTGNDLKKNIFEYDEHCSSPSQDEDDFINDSGQD